MQKFLNWIGLDSQGRAFFRRHWVATTALVVCGVLSVVVTHNGWILWAGGATFSGWWLYNEAKREESEQDSDLDK